MIGEKVRGVCLIALAAAIWLPRPALAQTLNPTKALFEPSPDHNATDTTGAPVVQSYRLELYLSGATAPFQTVSLGKPNPDGTGTITVDLTTIFTGWPVPGTNYFADVAAVGPGGATPSAPSNTFTFSGSTTCSFTVSPTSQAVTASAASQTAAVTTTSGCAWSATSNASWITVTGGGSGTSSGTVTYSVAANAATTSRTGTLTVAGRTVTVTQSGVPCAFVLSPTSQSVVAAGGVQTVSVTTTSGCAWSATSSASWIMVTGGSSGTTSGTVTYSVAANTGASSRTGTLTVAGKTLTVTQSGAACSFTVSPTSQSVAAGGGVLTTTVTTASGCAWSVTSNVSWISVTGGSSRTGNGTVTYNVAVNMTTSPRTGTLTIAGQTVTVIEASGVVLPSAPLNLRVGP